MNSIITYLILYNQYLLKQISQLLLFIAKYIPLKQWAFDDSHSPEYQKFKVDKLPKIFVSEPIDYEFLLAYYQHKYGKTVKPTIVDPRTLSQKPLNVLAVVHPISTYSRIMALKDNAFVKSATSVSMKRIFTTAHLPCAVPIAVTYWLPRKIVSTFASINV